MDTQVARFTASSGFFLLVFFFLCFLLSKSRLLRLSDGVVLNTHELFCLPLMFGFSAPIPSSVLLIHRASTWHCEFGLYRRRMAARTRLVWLGKRRGYRANKGVQQYGSILEFFSEKDGTEGQHDVVTETEWSIRPDSPAMSSWSRYLVTPESFRWLHAAVTRSNWDDARHSRLSRTMSLRSL